MEAVGYSTPESEAKKLLPEDVQKNPIVYPPESILKKAETYVSLPEDTGLMVDTLWAQVKMGGSGQTGTLVAVLVGFLLVYIGIVVYKKIKRKRELR